MLTDDHRKDVVLLRHGELESKGLYIGSSESCLSTKGIDNLAIRKDIFRKFNFQSIYCSPKLRCLETLNIILPGYSYTINEDLREIDFGEWEGLSFKQVSENYPGHVTKWAQDEDSFEFPNGESIASFRRRIENIQKTIEKENRTPILIVAHGGVIRHLLCFLLRLPVNAYSVFFIDYGKYARLQLFNQGGMLTKLNG